MSTADRSKEIYNRDLKVRLEESHPDEFVAIEPESKSYFVGDTFIDAALLARRAHPDRKVFVIRIGHEAAFHFGASSS